MKKLFLFVALMSGAAFGATPPGGLAFKDDNDCQRCCVNLVKMGAYDAAAFACHALGLYISHLDVTNNSYLYKKTLNDNCDMSLKAQAACGYIFVQSMVQCCLYCFTKPLCCSRSNKHYNSFCRAINSIDEQSVKKKHNAFKMARD